MESPCTWLIKRKRTLPFICTEWWILAHLSFFFSFLIWTKSKPRPLPFLPSLFQSPSRLCLCRGLPILLGPSAGSCLSALSDGRVFDPVGVWLPGSCYASSPRRGKLNLTFSGKMVSPSPAPGNAPLTGKQHVKCSRVQSERVASVTGCHCLGACDSVLEERCVYTRKCTYGR